MPIHKLRRYLHRAVAATALAALLPMAGCRKEIPMIRSEAEYVTSPTSPERIEGFFLVNEGNMGWAATSARSTTSMPARAVTSATSTRSATPTW